MGRATLWAGGTAALICTMTSLASGAIKPQAGLAYTDPGSGAMIIQLLTTFALMAAFYFSRARQWMAKRLGLGSSSSQGDAPARDRKDEGPPSSN
jgi:hypothetical protein